MPTTTQKARCLPVLEAIQKKYLQENIQELDESGTAISRSRYTGDTGGATVE